MFDLKNTTTLTSINNRKRQSYDIRFSDKQEKFQFADHAFERLSLKNHSVNVHVDANNNVALGIVPGNRGLTMTKREGYDKTKTFTAHKLRKYLDMAGLEGEEEFALIKRGVLDRGDHSEYIYEVAAWGDRAESPLMDSGAMVTDISNAAAEPITETEDEQVTMEQEETPNEEVTEDEEELETENPFA